MRFRHIQKRIYTQPVSLVFCCFSARKQMSVADDDACSGREAAAAHQMSVCEVTGSASCQSGPRHI